MNTRTVGAAVIAAAMIAAPTAQAQDAAGQAALSPDARCFVISVSIAQSEMQKKRDTKLYDNTAMFFVGRLDANKEPLPDVDLDDLIATMTREEFGAAAKQCIDEVGAAMKRLQPAPAKAGD